MSCGIFAISGPQPPVDILTTVHENNSIVVQWTADNSTGYAKLFKIHLTFENSIYEKPLGCENSFKRTMILETHGTSIELTNLEPFSKYSLKLVAVNNYGVSDKKKVFFNTKPSSSSPPRGIAIEFIDNENEESSILNGVLKWLLPCKLNGLFSLYTITLKGNRPGYSEHSITEASSYPHIEIRNLKRGYNYEAKVQTLSSGFTGLAEKFHFTVPSGSK